MVPCCILAVLLAWPVSVQAADRALVVSVDRVEAGAATAQDVRVRLTPGARLAVEVAASRVELPALGYRWRQLRWDCAGSLAWPDLACRGPLRGDGDPPLAGGAAAELAVSIDQGATTLTVGVDQARLRVGFEPAAPGRVDVRARALPLAWLQPLSAGVWPDGRLGAGEVDADARVDLRAPDRPELTAELAFRDAGLDTPDGLIAAEGLGGRFAMRFDGGPDTTRVGLRGELLGGEWLAGNLYVPMPGTAVELALDAVVEASGVRIEHLHWRDGAALVLESTLRLDPSGAPVQGHVRAASQDAATLGERYLGGLLAPLGLSRMRFGGGVELDLDLAQGRARALSLALHDLNIIDGDGRFSFAGLRGKPRWVAGGERIDSRVSWAAGAVYGLGLGPVELPLESRATEIGLAAPVAMDLLGGRLAFSHFVVRAGGDPGEGRVGLGLELTGLDLGDLSQRLGWPPFVGTVEGRIPSAVYADDRLVLDGGLVMRVFDGELWIGELAMERPFGVAPTLSADVDFTGIALQPLTAAFGFGEIVGGLAGHLRGLRLVDWSPVAFDAHLHSDPDYRGRRRISQRAVRDISSVGGNFIVTELQNQVLRLFSSFGYREIGIRCRLLDQVCRMDGIGSRGGGYTIVEGAGLPRLTVVGFRRLVDWPLLLERLKLATEGQMPVID